jgi:hypothetical protein
MRWQLAVRVATAAMVIGVTAAPAVAREDDDGASERAVLAAQAEGAVQPAERAAPAPEFPVLLPKLAEVYVTDHEGRVTRGRLIELDRHRLALTTSEGPRSFTVNDVRKIERRGDSLKNGAIIGALVGILPAILSLQGSSGDLSAGETALWVLGGVAVYSALGVAVDALIVGRTTVYPVANGGSAGAAVPGSTARPTRPGARVTLTWRF